MPHPLARSYTFALFTCGLLLASLAARTAHAVPNKDKDSVSGGSWNDPARWNPAIVPVAGESIFINHALTVNSNASFGGLGDTSIWNGPALFDGGAGTRSRMTSNSAWRSLRSSSSSLTAQPSRADA